MGLVDAWMEWAARRYLRRLGEQVGAAGLAVATGVPGVMAAVDQHSAAVRDIVTQGAAGPPAEATAVLLAGYARGVLDHARRKGWRLQVPMALDAWCRADWMTMRLVSVCSLARGLGEPVRDGAPQA